MIKSEDDQIERFNSFASNRIYLSLLPGSGMMVYSRPC